MLRGVSSTAILTLRARADEHRRADRLFEDPVAVRWFDELLWPPELDAWYADGAQNNLAFRVDDFDQILTAYAETQPTPPSIVELGCGLSTRPLRLEGLGAAWTSLDLPEVVELRQAWGASGAHVSASVLDPAWPDQLSPGPHVFVAEGLFYYLPRADVGALLRSLGRRFPGSVLVMDVLGPQDYPKLLENTQRVGAPVQWHLEGGFSGVFERLGVDEVEGFEPDTLMRRAIARYFHRLPPALKMMSWWAMHQGGLPETRSGNILARLRAD